MRGLDRQVLIRLVLPLAAMALLAALQRPDLSGLRFGPGFRATPGLSALYLGLAVGQVPALLAWRRFGVESVAGASLALAGVAAAGARLAPFGAVSDAGWLLCGVFQAGLLAPAVIAIARLSPQRLWGFSIALVLAALPLALVLDRLIGLIPAPAGGWTDFAIDLGGGVIGIAAMRLKWPRAGLAAEQEESLRLVRGLEATRFGARSLIERPLRDPRPWLWAAAGLALSAATAAIPLLAGRGASWIPWLLVAAGMLLSGACSDRFGGRYWYVGLSAAGASIALIVAVAPGLAFGWRGPALDIAALAMGGALGAFWPPALRRLKAPALPPAVALIGAACALGQLFGQPLTAWARLGGASVLPVYLIANLLTMGAAMMLCAASFDMRLDLAAPGRARR